MKMVVWPSYLGILTATHRTHAHTCAYTHIHMHRSGDAFGPDLVHMLSCYAHASACAVAMEAVDAFKDSGLQGG